MNNCPKLKHISDYQITQYIFNELPQEENELVEAYLLENENAFALSLELSLLVLEKGLSKEELLGTLKRIKHVHLN